MRTSLAAILLACSLALPARAEASRTGSPEAFDAALRAERLDRLAIGAGTAALGTGLTIGGMAIFAYGEAESLGGALALTSLASAMTSVGLGAVTQGTFLLVDESADAPAARARVAGASPEQVAKTKRPVMLRSIVGLGVGTAVGGLAVGSYFLRAGQGSESGSGVELALLFGGAPFVVGTVIAIAGGVSLASSESPAPAAVSLAPLALRGGGGLALRASLD